MSTWPAPSVLDARTQAFPVLTTAQIDRIRPAGKLRKVEPGEILFQPDDMGIPFFVLLSGGMEIVQPIPTGGAGLSWKSPPMCSSSSSRTICGASKPWITPANAWRRARWVAITTTFWRLPSIHWASYSPMFPARAFRPRC